MTLFKQYDVDLKSAPDDDPEGTIIALASVFGTVDLVGDRVIKGAFTKTLRKWRESGDPIPIILSHQWGDVNAHIGVADPVDVKQTPMGLIGKGKLDIHDNPVAAQTFKLLKRRSLKAFSFGYRVLDEELTEDGINDLKELDLIEFGPTLRGAHPDAELLGVKDAVMAMQVKSGQLRQRTEEAAMEIAMGGRPKGPVASFRSDDPGLVESLAENLMGKFAEMGILSEDQVKMVWTTAYVNDLPDSAFLYIAPGGDKDEDGKTTPRSLRFFPVRDASGKVDLPHVRNALARISQAGIPQEAKDAAQAKAERLLREHGGSPSKDDDEEPEGVPTGTGKRDEDLRRQTREVALDLALGRDPEVKTPKREPEKKDEPEVKEDPPPAASPITLVIGGQSFDPQTIATQVVKSLKDDEPDPPEDEEGKSEEEGEDEKLDAKALRERTNAAALELALGEPVRKSTDKPEDPPEITPDAIAEAVGKHLEQAGIGTNVEQLADEVAKRLKSDDPDDDEDEATGRDPLRAKHDRDRLEAALGEKPKKPAKKDDEDVDLKDLPSLVAKAVTEKLEEERSQKEVKKDKDKKPDEATSKSRDPLRKRTDALQLEQALGRAPQDVPDIAQPEPEPEAKEVPDEKVLRRQTNNTALELALGGFE